MPSLIDPRTEGYMLLAGAVVQQTVNDLQHGTPGKRKDACACVRCGALDFWVDKIAPNGYAYRAICAKLRELARP